MAIVNIAKKKGFFITKIRSFFEHRALWMYLLCDEARKKGLDPEQFAPAAIRRCGCFHGQNAVKAGGGKSLKTLQKQLFPFVGRMVFEMKFLRVEDNHFDIDFHYCPLVSSWQKQGAGDREMDRMCQWAMEGDRGIAGEFGAELDLNKTIAHGDGVCELRFRRK
ncbi:MAG: L-2-amino-thiazoline-4-carboxylic acid hydrolase [Treponema sp.]|jgi:hypothetical protein|nr:L-2-amino-thiazoline-4-carboxylic acid hydrolase [Treponema sp.]